MRIDKWLWSVRLYKSRTLATEACKQGRVKSGNQVLKPASQIHSGQTLQIRKQGLMFEYRVVELLEKRVGAALAEKAYVNLTTQETLDKWKGINSFASSFYIQRPKGSGRPTKKERRQVDGLVEDHFKEEEE